MEEASLCPFALIHSYSLREKSAVLNNTETSQEILT